MKTRLQRIITGASAMAAAGASQAHPGAHGADGTIATLGHLLLEHGWLVLMATAVVLLACRPRPVLTRPRKPGEER